jgi:chromosome segregation ATPase
MSNDRDDRDDRDIDLLNTAAQVLGSLGQGSPRIQFGDKQPEYTLEQLEEMHSGDFVAEDLIAELRAEIERLKEKLAMVQILKAKHHEQDRHSTARVAELQEALHDLRSFSDAQADAIAAHIKERGALHTALQEARNAAVRWRDARHDSEYGSVAFRFPKPELPWEKQPDAALDGGTSKPKIAPPNAWHNPGEYDD